jgi:hypothetical protein
MAAPTRIQLAWLSSAAAASRDGFAKIRELGALASDFADSAEIQALTSADFAGDGAGTFKDFDARGVATALEGLAAVSAVLDANDGAYRKAFKALSLRA